MRLKSLILGLCLSVFSIAHAENVHVHPQATEADKKVSAEQGPHSSSYCGITIENISAYTIHVSGVFDDNSPLRGFDVYPYENPHYIDLFYYGACHPSMYLKIESNVYPYPILHAGQTYAGTYLRIVNSLADTVKVEAVRK